MNERKREAKGKGFPHGDAHNAYARKKTQSAQKKQNSKDFAEDNPPPKATSKRRAYLTAFSLNLPPLIAMVSNFLKPKPRNTESEAEAIVRGSPCSPNEFGSRHSGPTLGWYRLLFVKITFPEAYCSAACCSRTDNLNLPRSDDSN